MSKRLRVLVGCEESGVVRQAFEALGHDAWSCDLQPSRVPGKHYQRDIFEVLNDGWDIAIMHPPCTHVCVSGNRWYAGSSLRAQAVLFIERLWDASIHIPKVAFENPVGVLPKMSKLGEATQYIQPWQFGHGETKKTGLWLRGLSPLISTLICSERVGRVWRMGPGVERQRERSQTYSGIACAMASQWGAL